MTTTDIKTRVYNHKNNLKPKSKTGTALSKHAKTFGHDIDFDKIKILHKSNSKTKLKTIESFYIAIHENSIMNSKQEASHIPKHYSQIVREQMK